MKKIILYIIVLLVSQLALHFDHRSVAIAQEKDTLSKILSQNKIVGLSYWDVGKNPILCIITDHVKKRKDMSIPFRQLRLYEMRNNFLAKKYEMETPDNLVAVSSLSDGNLMALWMSGSAFRVNIFSAVDAEVRLVLKEGSKTAPEAVDLNNDGTEEILISSGSVFLPNNKIEPETTRIYKWDGKSYRLIKTVPWRGRLTP